MRSHSHESLLVGLFGMKHFRVFTVGVVLLILIAALGSATLGAQAEQKTPFKITGQLKAWGDAEIHFPACQIKAEWLAATTEEQLTLVADKNGIFSFETAVENFGVVVYSADGKMAGPAFIEDPKQPLEIELYPTHDYTGQILDHRRQPVADHNVWAWIEVTGGSNSKLASQSTLRTSVHAKTDADGNFTLENLPCKTVIRVGTDVNGSAPNAYVMVETLEIQPEDLPRPRKVQKLRQQYVSGITSRYRRSRRDCELAGHHLLMIFYNTSDAQLLTKSQLMENFRDTYKSLKQENSNFNYGWNTMFVDASKLNKKQDRKLAKLRKWNVDPGGVLICAYDSTGKQLGRKKTFVFADPKFSDLLKALMANNVPTRPNASDKWETAFATANESGRRVLVTINDFSQVHGRRLRRWIDESKETLEKDFVLLNIDTRFDLRVDETLAALQDLEYESPSMVILDADQNVVTHGGALSFPTNDNLEKTLQQVLEQGCQKINGDEIKRIVSKAAWVER